MQVQSRTEIKNSELIRDEIITQSANFLRILDVKKYKFEQHGEDRLLKDKVTAGVDTGEIEKLKIRRNEHENGRTKLLYPKIFWAEEFFCLERADKLKAVL